ncbi:MAG: TRASH domain-containing protein, partial [Phycisphaerales bacterium]|nr:TRASH domain-containing protein [Phycisphaerales bacterium]
MNRIPLTALCACCAIFSAPALAGPGHGSHADQGHAKADTAKPVNAICPVGEEPVEADGGRTIYKGKTIGFCCPGCIKRFNAWDETKKDKFVAMSMMGAEAGMQDDHAQMAQDAQAPTERVGDPYLLDTCPISGGKLGSMGDPIVKLYNGREVKFCCKMCVPKFEKDLKASLANLDQKIIESQLPLYPTTTCVVSGDTLGDEEMGDPINYVYNNRLIRLCCKMCKGDFKKDPQAYIAKLDKAVIAQQSEHYPLTTCPISGGELGSMGDAINAVYGGRLVKFCCKMCVPKFEANPMPTIQKIDA